MTFPTIHRNGSNGTALLEEYATAHSAAFALLASLSNIDLNSRDYYPQGPVAFETARTEMRARYASITNLRHELELIMDSIMRQQEVKQ